MKRMKRKLSIVLFAVMMQDCAADLVDPTRPPDFSMATKTQQPTGTLKVSAIFVYPSYKFAIINNQRYTVGDKIGQYTVVGISVNKIELLGPDNKKEVLELVTGVKS